MPEANIIGTITIIEISASNNDPPKRFPLLAKTIVDVFIFLCMANSGISGKFSIYPPYGVDSFSTYDRIKGVNMENSPSTFHI